MASRITVRQSLYDSRGDHLRGCHVEDPDRLRELLENADRSLDRSEGGYFFEILGNEFVFGFLTPWSSERKGDFFYHLFSLDANHATQLDLPQYRDALDEHLRVCEPSDIAHETVYLPTDSTIVDEEDTDSVDVTLLASSWDRIRREDTYPTMSLEEASSLATPVDGWLEEISYVSVDYARNDYFSLRGGEEPVETHSPPAALVTYLDQKQEEVESLRWSHLPAPGEEYTAVLEAELESSVADFRRTIDVSESMQTLWSDFYQTEIEPDIEQFVDDLVELYECRLDPRRDLNERLDTESTHGLFDGSLLSRSDKDPFQEAIERYQAEALRSIQRAIERRLIHQLDSNLESVTNTMTDEVDDRAEAFRRSDGYQQFFERSETGDETRAEDSRRS